MLMMGCRVRTCTRPYAVNFDDVGNDAHVDIDGVCNAEINVELMMLVMLMMLMLMVGCRVRTHTRPYADLPSQKEAS